VPGLATTRTYSSRARFPLWLLPSVACATVWLVLGTIALHGDSLASGGEVGRIGILRAAYGFALWTHDLWTSHWDEACALAYWLLFAWVAIERLRPRTVEGGIERTPNEQAPGGRVYVPFVCALVFYFVAPFRLGAAITLNVRLAPMVALLALPLLDLDKRPASARQVALAFVVALVVPAMNALEIRRIDHEEAIDADALFAAVPPGARLAALNFRTQSPRMHFAPWPHLGAYSRIRHGGVASWSFSEMHHWPLQYAPGVAPPSHGTFWEFRPCVFRNAEDGAYYDYVVARGGVDPFRDEPTGPAWRRVASQRDYTLYERTGGVWPAWSVPDEGPCRARRDLEAAAEARRASGVIGY
jgi:hypothetical protein